MPRFLSQVKNHVSQIVCVKTQETFIFNYTLTFILLGCFITLYSLMIDRIQGQKFHKDEQMRESVIEPSGRKSLINNKCMHNYTFLTKKYDSQQESCVPMWALLSQVIFKKLRELKEAMNDQDLNNTSTRNSLSTFSFAHLFIPTIIMTTYLTWNCYHMKKYTRDRF